MPHGFPMTERPIIQQDEHSRSCSTMPLLVVDCPPNCHAVRAEDRRPIISTNPFASRILAQQGIRAVRAGDVCSVEDLVAIHAQVRQLIRRLRARFDETTWASSVPSPFQVYAYHLSVLWFSLLMKWRELDRVLEPVRQHGRSTGASLEVIAACDEKITLEYPLCEDTSVYAWLVARWATMYGLRLKWTRVVPNNRGRDRRLSAVREIVRRRLWTLRSVWRLVSSASIESASRLGGVGGAGTHVVLGWRTYQVGLLPKKLLRELGLRLYEPWDLLMPRGDRIEFTPQVTRHAAARHAGCQESGSRFAYEMSRIAKIAVEETLGTAPQAVTIPAAELMTASLSGYVTDCRIIEDYLARMCPVGFLSSALSASVTDRLIALLCRRLGIPVIALQHGGSYGELSQRCSEMGIDIYLDELELADTFVAFGSGSAQALARALRSHLPSASRVQVVAASALDLPATTSQSPRATSMAQAIKHVLYLPHALQVNAIRTAAFRDRYVEHLYAMCGLLSEQASRYQVTVKLHPSQDYWQRILVRELAAYPQLTIVHRGWTVAELAAHAQLAIIDLPITSLSYVLPLPVHILTVELMEDLYPGLHLMDAEALTLLRKRCLIAPSHNELRELVRRCLLHPLQVSWPDLHDDSYLHQFMGTPKQARGYEGYVEALRGLRERPICTASLDGVVAHDALRSQLASAQNVSALLNRGRA